MVYRENPIQMGDEMGVPRHDSGNLPFCYTKMYLYGYRFQRLRIVPAFLTSQRLQDFFPLGLGDVLCFFVAGSSLVSQQRALRRFRGA